MPKPQLQLTLNGKTQSIAAWSRETGINEPTIRARLADGWPTARALTPKPMLFQGFRLRKERRAIA